MSDEITVVLVDDQSLLRRGLRMVLDAEDDLRVVGEAGTGGEAVTLVGRTRPDVVLMDVRMPGMDGIEATRLIAAAQPASRVLVLDHLRPGRVRLRGAAGRGQRVPAEERAPRRADLGHPRDRRG